MAMTAEHFQAIMTSMAENQARLTAEAISQAMVAVMSNQGASTVGGDNRAAGGNRGRLIHPKSFEKIDKFDGSESMWIEWAYVFRMTVSTASADANSVLDIVEAAASDIRTSELAVLHDWGGLPWQRLMREFFEILVTNTSGEALRIVRAVEGFDGFQAWWKLCKRFSPRTMARAVRTMLEVFNPSKVTDIRSLEEAVCHWEEKLRRLERDYPQEAKGITDNIKKAIFTSICPISIQDVVFQRIEDAEDYRKLRESVFTLVQNRITISGPTPMDIGMVKGDFENEEDIDALRQKNLCYECGGTGHSAKEWATRLRRQGKGGDGKGHSSPSSSQKGHWEKGSTKGGGKANFKGGGKVGKGYQGDCWKCGRKGHKQHECNSIEEERNESEDVDADEVMLETVWDLGSVEVDFGIDSGTRLKSPIEVKNMFQPLEACAFDDDAEYIMSVDDVKAPKRIEEITIDSGAGRNVWPKGKKSAGKMRKVEGKKVKLLAANGTDILVHGEKDIKFKVGGRACSMGFLITDVKKSLAAVSSLVDAGNTVVFSKGEYGNFIKNNTSGERIYMKRRKGTFYIEVEMDDDETGEHKKMDVDNVESKTAASEPVFSRRR